MSTTRPNIGRSRSSWLVRVIGVLLALTMLGLMARAATNTAMWWGIDGMVLATSVVMGGFAWFARSGGKDAADWRASLVSMGVVWMLLLLAWFAYVVFEALLALAGWM